MTPETLLLAAAGPATALIMAGVQRFFHAGTQEAAKTALGDQLAAAAVSASSAEAAIASAALRGELAQFRLDLMRSLDSTYRRTGECNLLCQSVERALASAEMAFSYPGKGEA